MKKLLFLIILLGGFGIINFAHAALTEGVNAGFVTVAPTGDPGVGFGFIDGWVAGNPFVAPANASSMTSMGWYSYSISEESAFELGIYSHDSVNNRPLTLLASSTAAKGTAAGWKSINFSYPIVASTTYWLTAQIDNTATATNIEFTNGVGPKEDYNGPGITALKPTWETSGNRAAALMAIYATYTTSTPPAAPVADQEVLIVSEE